MRRYAEVDGISLYANDDHVVYQVRGELGLLTG